MAAMLSVNVTVQVVVPAGSPADVTTGRKVIELSELTVTLLFQFVIPLQPCQAAAGSACVPTTASASSRL